MEDIVIVESKDYAQVVFDDVKECFMENQPLECLFNLNELLKPNGSDWIGIYKVGFVNIRDFVCTQPVSVESIDNNKGKVTFQSDKLPKDDGEFYQFVYLSQSKQIRGASIPFQFKKTHLSDYIQVEDQEAVLIKSKESAINETISEIKTRCVNLTQANQTYENLVKENEELIQILKEEVSSVKLRCLRLTMDNEKLNFALKLKAENLKSFSTQINSLTDENNKLQSKFDDLNTENKNLYESLQQRIDQISQLKSDLENVKMDQIAKLEKQVDDKVDELNNIKCDLKRNEAIVSEQALTIQKILTERDTLNSMILKLTKEKNELEFNHENLSQELTMSKDKLMAAEQCKEMLRAQLIVLTDELNEANKTIEVHLNTIKNFSSKEKQYEEDKAELVEKIEKIKIDYDSKLDESKGSHLALKLAHVHLESRLKIVEQEKLKLDKENELKIQEIEKFKTENKELKERIKEGAKEYSKLFEKYRLIKNQQFNYDMNVYQDLNGDNILIRKDLRINRQSFMGTSTPNTNEHQQETSSDSAIQERTISSQNGARASSADIENTLMDALLASSFGWNNSSNNNNNNKQKATSTQDEFEHANLNQTASSSSSHTATITTTTQPKMTNTQALGDHQHNQEPNDLSDDGLINLNTAVVNQNRLGDLKNNLLESRRNNDDYDDDSSNLMDFGNACKPIDFINLRSEFNNNCKNNNDNIQSNLRDEDDNVFGEQNRQLSRCIEAKKNTSSNIKATYTHTRLFDAANIQTCDICNYIFPTDSNVNEVEKHYSVHYGPSCPVCFLLFRKGYPQNEFEDHVNSHFAI